MFSSRKLILLAAGFVAAFVAANVSLRLLHHAGLQFHFIPSWPINVFGPSEATRQHRIVVALLTLAAFFAARRLLDRCEYRLRVTITVAFVLLLGSTLMQGWGAGFIDPITRDEFNDEETPQYYHDAIEIRDARAFFSNYNALQPTLHMHARNHPPGPVLLIYALLKLLRQPVLISITIAAVAFVLSGFFFYKLLLLDLPTRMAGSMTFLFLLLPSVQIYYLVTIDALVAGLLLGVFYCFVRGEIAHLIACGALLVAALMLTLIAIWIVPVLVGFELVRQRRIFRSMAVIAGVTAVYVVIDLLSGFNLLRCFMTASAIENASGFALLHRSLDYFVTRLQCIGELILFFGPFLCALLLRRLREAHAETWFAIISLGLMLLAGTFRIGETARVCNFIYPFLLLPIARSFCERGEEETKQLSALVYTQTILMQAAGSYFW